MIDAPEKDAIEFRRNGPVNDPPAPAPLKENGKPLAAFPDLRHDRRDESDQRQVERRMLTHRREIGDGGLREGRVLGARDFDAAADDQQHAGE